MIESSRHGDTRLISELPLPAQVLKKIESASSAFIFWGRHERLKLDKLENTVEKGGLGLICVATKCDCLLLRQSLRILQREEENCYKHLSNWIGKFLEEDFPAIGAMLVLIQEGLLREEFKPTASHEASVKTIYANQAADVIPPPKVELKHPAGDFKAVVYPRLANSILEAEPKHILFCLTHNLQPNRERLFEQHRAHNAFCPLPQCQGQVQDRGHLFCSCFLVSEAWIWVRSKLLQFLPNNIGAGGTSGEEFILLKFPTDTMDKEIVWLIGHYCDIVKKIAIEKKRRLGAGQVAGLLWSRLLALRERAVVQPLIFSF